MTKDKKQEEVSIELQPQVPQIQEINIEVLIAKAIDQQLPVETMERFLAMRRELRAEKAKEAYDAAMTAFQGECPTIKKNKKVYEKNSTTKVRYTFAPIDSIVDQTKPFLAKHGLSYTFKTVQDEKTLTIICKSTHKLGHSEETSVTLPVGSEEFMTLVQKYGARITFAKRYALCNAFGISTGDEDTDAKEEDEKKEAKILEDSFIKNINDAKDLSELAKIGKEIKEKIKPQLAVALRTEYARRRKEIEKENAAKIADDVDAGLKGDKNA